MDSTPDIKSRSQALSFIVTWHKSFNKQMQDYGNSLVSMNQKIELMMHRTEKLGAQTGKLALLQNSLSQISLDAGKMIKEISGLVKALSRVKKLNKEDAILQELKEVKEAIGNIRVVAGEGGGPGPSLNLSLKSGGSKTKARTTDVEASSDLLAMF